MANYTFENSSEEAGAVETLTRRVYETLRDEIISGKLEPGDRLARKKVAERLGVSPMPITEALYMLEVDGLVESKPLRGCRVRPLTLDSIENGLALREAIECHTARLCAEKASDAELTRLTALAKQLDQIATRADPNSKLGMQLHIDLHLGIAKATGYHSLGDELQRVWFQRYMYLNWINATIIDPVPANWHQKLMKSISGKDPAKAEGAMREHVRHGQTLNKESFDYFLEQRLSRHNSQPD